MTTTVNCGRPPDLYLQDSAYPMRILLALFALLLCIQRSQAGQFGKLFNSALALHKKRSADKGGAIGNIAHSKTKKIKVAPARPDNTKKDATKETSDGVKAATSATAEKVSVDNDEAIAKKQTAFNNGQQMTTSILTMLLSRMIFKLDYKNKRIVLLCRIAFCAYIVLSQVSMILLHYIALLLFRAMVRYIFNIYSTYIQYIFNIYSTYISVAVLVPQASSECSR